MYEIKIKTLYNEINIEREDIFTEEVQEILSQPYILEVEIHRTGAKKLVRKREEGRKGRETEC